MNVTIIERWMKWKLRLVDNDYTYVWLMVAVGFIGTSAIAFAVLLGFLGQVEFAAFFGFAALLYFFAAFKFWEHRQFAILFRGKEEEIRDVREELREVRTANRRMRSQLDWLHVEGDVHIDRTSFRD